MAYRYADLGPATRILGWLLLPVAVVTCAAFAHAMYTYALFTGFPADLPLAHLPALKHVLQRDDLLRYTQIALTVLFLGFFCVHWLFLALRNLLALHDAPPHSNLAIHLRIWINAVFALRLMQRLWLDSIPDSQRERTERWPVPGWWIALVAGNVCQAVAFVLLYRPALISDWRFGSYWLLAAYGCYIVLFLLTWQLVQRLAMLQRDCWQQLRAPVRA
jgi:hypothetical protein